MNRQRYSDMTTREAAADIQKRVDECLRLHAAGIGANDLMGNVLRLVGDLAWVLERKSQRVVVSDGHGNGLYDHEVCGVGTCRRPPGHEGRHDQFDEPQSSDSVPLHPLPKVTE